MSESVTDLRLSLVANTSSRTGQRAFPEALQILRSLGVTPTSTHPLRDPSLLTDTVRRLRDEGTDLIVLGGGDGTISSIVDFLAERDVALALLPLGTANDFARTMGIPTSLHQACETVANGKIVDVDLGLAGNNYYVNLASAGLSVGVTHALTAGLKKCTGPLSYPIATAKALRRHRPFDARISFPDGDHETIELHGLLQVAVGNGRFYGGGNVVAPGSGIDDRTLDVYAIETGTRRDLMKVAYRFRSGAFVNSANVHHFRTTRARVETDPELSLNLDGELEQRTPQDFAVARNALRVLVPQSSTAARDDTAGTPGQ